MEDEEGGWPHAEEVTTTNPTYYQTAPLTINHLAACIVNSHTIDLNTANLVETNSRFEMN